MHLIWLAHLAGSYLYGEDLEFWWGAEIEYTKLEDLQNELGESQGISPKLTMFSTYDYVFFPISNRNPMDVADHILLSDDRVYDDDDVCYCYSGEAGRIFVISKG